MKFYYINDRIIQKNDKVFFNVENSFDVGEVISMFDSNGIDMVEVKSTKDDAIFNLYPDDLRFVADDEFKPARDVDGKIIKNVQDLFENLFNHQNLDVDDKPTE